MSILYLALFVYEFETSPNFQCCIEKLAKKL